MYGKTESIASVGRPACTRRDGESRWGSHMGSWMGVLTIVHQRSLPSSTNGRFLGSATGETRVDKGEEREQAFGVQRGVRRKDRFVGWALRVEPSGLHLTCGFGHNPDRWHHGEISFPARCTGVVGRAGR